MSLKLFPMSVLLHIVDDKRENFKLYIEIVRVNIVVTVRK